MALIWQDVQKIRDAVYGIETREPIADALEERSNYEKVIDTEVRVEEIEAKNLTRIIRMTCAEMRREIGWIEIVEHIIHDPPTLYSIGTNGEGITVSLISNDDYRLNDSSSTGDSISSIGENDYKFTLGSSWTETPIDDPTHIEYEQVTHWVPDYILTLKRANEN